MESNLLQTTLFLASKYRLINDKEHIELIGYISELENENKKLKEEIKVLNNKLNNSVPIILQSKLHTNFDIPKDYEITVCYNNNNELTNEDKEAIEEKVERMKDNAN
jgi:hypothetical protein